MSRRPCRFTISTSDGDIDTRRERVVAADVEGRYLGTVSSQRDLARLERRHGRVLLGRVAASRGAQIDDRLRRDGQAGWAFLLAGGDGVRWSVSRQGNIRATTDAAARRTLEGPAPGDAFGLAEDDVLLSADPTGRALMIPLPDLGRFAYARPGRDPGNQWQRSFQRALTRRSRSATDAAAPLEQAGQIVCARAHHLAADTFKDHIEDLARTFGLWDPARDGSHTPTKLLETLEAAAATWNVRRYAYLELGMDHEAEELDRRIGDVEDLRVRWASGLAATTVELLTQLRPFGGGGTDALLDAGPVDRDARDALEAAMAFLPTEWIRRMPVIHPRTLDDTAGYSGLTEYSRAEHCAIIEVRPDTLLGDIVAVAAHELGHAAQLADGVGQRIRDAEETFLDQLLTHQHGGTTEVKVPVPGDVYAGLWDRGPDGDRPAELLPQLLSWLAFNRDRVQARDPHAAVDTWSQRNWPGAPDAFALCVGILGAA